MKTVFRLGLGLFLSVVGVSGSLLSATPFAVVWGKVSRESPSLLALKAQTETVIYLKSAQQKSLDPSVGIAVQSGLTDHPGQRLFSLIEQRAILGSDLTPAALNEPGSELVHTLSATVTWPLWDAGENALKVQALDKEIALATWQYREAYADHYRVLGLAYAHWLNDVTYREALKDMQDKLKKEMASYQFRSSDNPAGYAGWLGYQLLDQHLSLDLQGLDMQVSGFRETISGMGYGAASLTPERQAVSDFLTENFNIKSHQKTTSMAYERIRVQQESTAIAADLFDQKYQPKVSAGVSDAMTLGSRQVGSGYGVMGRVDWHVWDNSRTSGAAASQMSMTAATYRLQSQKLQDDAMRGSLTQQLETLPKMLVVAQEQSAVMNRQLDAMRKLLLSGSISTTQWVDALKQKILMRQQVYELNNQLIEVHIQLYRLTHFVMEKG